MRRTVTVTIHRLPPHRLASVAAVMYRVEAAEAMRRIRVAPPMRSIRVRPLLYFRRPGRRDRSKLSANLLPAIQALADAGIVERGCRPVCEPVEIYVDPTTPRVELHITETETKED